MKYSGPKYSYLELLSFETFQIVEKNETRTEIGQKIRQFLKEESIIERTHDCTRYFGQHFTPVAATLKVILTFKSFFMCTDSNHFFLRRVFQSPNCSQVGTQVTNLQILFFIQNGLLKSLLSKAKCPSLNFSVPTLCL